MLKKLTALVLTMTMALGLSATSGSNPGNTSGAFMINYSDPALLEPYYPDYSILFSPYFFESYDEIANLAQTDFGKRLQSECWEAGLMVLDGMSSYYGSRQIMSNVPVNSPADLKGLDFRVPNNATQMVVDEEDEKLAAMESETGCTVNRDVDVAAIKEAAQEAFRVHGWSQELIDEANAALPWPIFRQCTEARPEGVGPEKWAGFRTEL